MLKRRSYKAGKNTELQQERWRKCWSYYPKFGHIKRKILNGEIPDRTKLVIISGAYCILLHQITKN